MFTEENVTMVIGAPVANALNTDDNSSRIDMTGWDGIVFIAPITDSAATGVATLKCEGNSVDSDSGMTLLTGASAAKTCTVNDDLNDKALVLDVYKPSTRYVQAVRTSATANIAFSHVVAIKYKGRVKPPATDSTILTLVGVAGV